MQLRHLLPLLSLLTLCVSLLACTASTVAPAPSADKAGTIVQMNSNTGAAASSQAQATPAPVTLDPSRGQAIGFVYEAFLSPHQEPGEEKDTPALIPQQFRSTAPSLLRSERTAYGHGVVRFQNDLSKAYIDVQVENIKPEDVVLFHIHCGKPDMLGPILVDFAFSGSIQENLADGLFSVEITNADIEKVVESQHGLVGAFTMGCPITPGVPDFVKTIAGMEYIARQGELYFNLHTKGQVYYGDVRGQLHLVAE